MNSSRLWQWAYKGMFHAYFQELTAEEVAKRWYGMDLTTSILVTATASGSAVAGWSLWADPGWKELWIFVASVAAVGSLAHTAVGVTGRLKKQQEVRQFFSALRVKFQTLLAQIDIGLEPQAANSRFLVLQEELQKGTAGFDRDLLDTRRLRSRVEQEAKGRSQRFLLEELTYGQAGDN